MAEQDPHHLPADDEGEALSTNVNHTSASDEHKHEEAGVVLSTAHLEGLQSSSASNNIATEEHNAEEQGVIKSGEIAEEKTVPPLETPPENTSLLDVEDCSTAPQADDESCGDRNRLIKRNEHVAVKGEPEVGGQDTATIPASPIDREDDREDGPKSRLDKETPEANSTGAEAKGDGGNLDTAKNTLSPPRVMPQEVSDEEKLDEEGKPIETIGPSTADGTDGTAPVIPEGGGGSGRYLAAVIIVVAVAAVVQLFMPQAPQKSEAPQIDVFLRQMEALQSHFPRQRADLWKRSRIHLLRHLQTAQPTEPVSLILTAGVRAERTLHCLARDLASAFSTSLNASVLHIDGAGRASQDSDQVKLDIDSKLRGAFEGDQPVAVIHRFEELPPGSTLIFYRYCDHEHAAYKRTFLIFTVLLEEEEEIPAQSRLSDVEEMVDDHLQKKFLSDDQPVAFDKMDLDKYGGLWSRISHLILPVTAEERMERYGC